MTDKFTNLISKQYIINEMEAAGAPPAPAPDAGAPAGGDAAAPPAPPPPEPAKAEPDSQAVEDISLACRIAKQLDDLTPEDRAILIKPVDGESIDQIRELLNSIADKYDVPDV